MKDQTAKQVYSDRIKTARVELKRIERLLNRHEIDFIKEGRDNWGYVGDLGHVIETLKSIQW